MIKKILFFLLIFSFAYSENNNKNYFKNSTSINFNLPIVYFSYPNEPLFSILLSYERKTSFLYNSFEIGYKGIYPIMRPYGDENYPNCFPTFYLFSFIRFYLSTKNFDGFYFGPGAGFYFGLGEKRHFDYFPDVCADVGYSFIIFQNQRVDFGLRWSFFSFIELKFNLGILF